MSYVYLKNSDTNKYGSLKRSLHSQYALQNNQYPKTISKVMDVLTNHQWDDGYKTLVMKKREQNIVNDKNNDGKNDPGGTSLAQTNPTGPT